MDTWFEDMVAKAKRKSGCYEHVKPKKLFVCSKCGKFFSNKPFGRYSKKMVNKHFCSQLCYANAMYELNKNNR